MKKLLVISLLIGSSLSAQSPSSLVGQIFHNTILSITDRPVTAYTGALIGGLTFYSSEQDVKNFMIRTACTFTKASTSSIVETVGKSTRTIKALQFGSVATGVALGMIGAECITECVQLLMGLAFIRCSQI